MSYGYSLRLTLLNHTADECLLGVRLGRLCIQRNRPVADVATALRVSRQTVYNWFSGVNAPRASMAEAVESYIEALT